MQTFVVICTLCSVKSYCCPVHPESELYHCALLSFPAECSSAHHWLRHDGWDFLVTVFVRSLSTNSTCRRQQSFIFAFQGGGSLLVRVGLTFPPPFGKTKLLFFCVTFSWLQHLLVCLALKSWIMNHVVLKYRTLFVTYLFICSLSSSWLFVHRLSEVDKCP